MKIWANLLRQPVLVGLAASAVALFGLAAMLSLPIRPNPQLPPSLIDISTSFPGAPASAVDNFVTLPLQSAFASISGVDYVTGNSEVGSSDVQAFLAPGASVNTVYAEILAAANAARANLPVAVQPSVIRIQDGNNVSIPSIILGLSAPKGVKLSVLTAYGESNIVPRLQTISGTSGVSMAIPAPSLKVQLNPLRMQALGITASQVAQTLSNAANVASAGTLYNSAASFPVNTGGDLASASAFNNLPLGADTNNALARVGDLTSSSVDFLGQTPLAWWNGKLSTFVLVNIAPNGNILDVSKKIHEQVKQIQAMLPPGVKLTVVYDESTSISRSLHDLALTLFVTILLVAGITIFSLGSFSAALAPLVAILLSLLGAALAMQICGQSLNLFTIIALVLAVGLVVDDAIVVVEDIFRRTAEGAKPHDAAASAITRLAPVLAAISLTLVVAFLPLGFLSGLTATLFRPFALVLIAALLFSLAVSLGIVPSIAMWASRYYKHQEKAGIIDHFRDTYVRMLRPTINHSMLVAVAVAGVIIICIGLARYAPHNLNPAPDGLQDFINGSGPSSASTDYYNQQGINMQKALHQALPHTPLWVGVNNGNVNALYSFNTPGEAAAAVGKITNALAGLDGIQPYVMQLSGLPGSDGLPVSINISGRIDYNKLTDIANKIVADGNASGAFAYLTNSSGSPQYQYQLHINRLLAAQLGVSEATIDNEINAAMSGTQLGQATIKGTTLNIVLTTPTLMSSTNLLALPLRTNNGQIIPLSTVATLQGEELSGSLSSWQGLPSVMIMGEPMPGVPLNKALAILKKSFNAQDNIGLSFGYSGPSEAYQQANKQNTKLFGFGLAGLFFLLAAQFRSLRDPFVVIGCVPLASLGPLLLCLLGGATLNIVTEIALLTVWGLIARQGILFVQVAHEGREMGFNVKESALRAARLRFRPILMITLALLGGALPLLLATGPQATIRYDLGAILATGMSGGFILSLFAVPSLYCLFHGGHHEN